MLTEKPWKADLLLMLGLGLLFSMALGNSLAMLWRRDHEDSLAALVVGTLSFHGVLLALVAWFLRAHGIDWSDAFGLRATHAGRALPLALGVTILLLPVTWLLSLVTAWGMTLVHLDPVAQKPVTLVQQTVAVGPRLFLAFMAIVLAPVAEEILFRGLLFPFFKTVFPGQAFPRVAVRLRAGLYPWTRRTLGRRPALWLRGVLCRQLRQPWPLWAALVTALIFGVIHLNLLTFLPLTLLGLAFAWLYQVTGNLLAPILAHSLFNLANFFLLIAVPVNP